MTITHNFAAAYRRAAVCWPGPQLAPAALAAAIVEVTDADGAGFSVFDGLGVPVPIGASCGKSALAERLQFTVGQGPCHDAHRTGGAVVATEAVMAGSWPAYHDLLVTQTLFRSVAAMPLRGPFASMATIDLLFHDPSAAATVPLAQIGVLCRHITAALIESDLIAADSALPAAQVGDDEGRAPVWLAGPAGVARRQVMVAAGMLSVHVGVSAPMRWTCSKPAPTPPTAPPTTSPPLSLPATSRPPCSSWTDHRPHLQLATRRPVHLMCTQLRPVPGPMDSAVVRSSVAARRQSGTTARTPRGVWCWCRPMPAPTSRTPYRRSTRTAPSKCPSPAR